MTYSTLLNTMRDRFTIDQVAGSIELSTLYEFLRYKCSQHAGNYIDTMPNEMESLINKHLSE